jgi:hypothetical protein
LKLIKNTLETCCAFVSATNAAVVEASDNLCGSAAALPLVTRLESVSAFNLTGLGCLGRDGRPTEG